MTNTNTIKTSGINVDTTTRVASQDIELRYKKGDGDSDTATIDLRIDFSSTPMSQILALAYSTVKISWQSRQRTIASKQAKPRAYIRGLSGTITIKPEELPSSGGAGGMPPSLKGLLTKMRAGTLTEAEKQALQILGVDLGGAGSAGPDELDIEGLQ